MVPGFGEGQEGYQNWRNFTLPDISADMDAVYGTDDPTRAWIDAFSDLAFGYPMQVWARSMKNVSSNAYLYWFTWHPPVENSDFYRAFHAGELGHTFGNLTLFGATPTDADHAFSDRMATLWPSLRRPVAPTVEVLKPGRLCRGTSDSRYGPWKRGYDRHDLF